MNSLEAVMLTAPDGKEDECAKFTIDAANSTYTFNDISTIGQKYVFGCYVKSDAAGSITIDGETTQTSSTWTRLVRKFTASAVDFVITFPTEGTYYLYNSKLEIGTVDTDWSPAPEDLTSDVTQIESTIVETTERVNTLEQNTTGWEFNFSEISQQITDINGQLTVDSISSKIKYIRFEDGVIKIGIEGNDLELHISNDRVSFLETGVEVAYISNQQLYITNAEVTDNLKIGKFQFVPRDNGNLTLKYIG